MQYLSHVDVRSDTFKDISSIYGYVDFSYSISTEGNHQE